MSDQKILLVGRFRQEVRLLLSLLGFPPDHVAPNIEGHYNSFVISTGRHGKERRIHTPDALLMPVQKAILQNLIGRVQPHPAATAYFPGRSILANAQAHHLCEYLYKTDIQDFFPSISVVKIAKALSAHVPAISDEARQELCRLTTLNNGLPQGAPTSPCLSNLALFDFDRAASAMLSGLSVTYTRYADDISVSAPDRARIEAAAAIIAVLLQDHGFRQHVGKTRIAGPGQPKVVTGLDVSCPVIRPTRAFRKKTAALIWVCERNPRKHRRIAKVLSGRLAFWDSVSPEDEEFLDLVRRVANLKQPDTETSREAMGMLFPDIDPAVPTWHRHQSGDDDEIPF